MVLEFMDQYWWENVLIRKLLEEDQKKIKGCNDRNFWCRRNLLLDFLKSYIGYHRATPANKKIA